MVLLNLLCDLGESLNFSESHFLVSNDLIWELKT